jgi:hypothetical protein
MADNKGNNKEQENENDSEENVDGKLYRNVQDDLKKQNDSGGLLFGSKKLTELRDHTIKEQSKAEDELMAAKASKWGILYLIVLLMSCMVTFVLTSLYLVAFIFLLLIWGIGFPYRKNMHDISRAKAKIKIATEELEKILKQLLRMKKDL